MAGSESDNNLAKIIEAIHISSSDSDTEDEAEAGDTVTNATRANDIEETVSDHRTLDGTMMASAEKENKKGQKALKKKEFEMALGHFEEAIKLNPTEVSLHFHVARVKFEQKKYGECIEFCNKAVKVGKENKGNVKMVASSRILCGMAWKRQGNIAKGKAEVEKAHNFLVNIAMVKLGKKQYFEAFDFINESKGRGVMLRLLTEEEKDWLCKSEGRGTNQFIFQTKVCVEYLEEYMKSLVAILGYNDKESAREIIRQKQLGDEAFKKNDYEKASQKYIRVLAWSALSARKTLSFLMEHAKAAEERKKWTLCYMLGVIIPFLLNAWRIWWEVFEVETNEDMMSVDWNEIRVRQGKALRRTYGLGEKFDQRFLENACSEWCKADELRRRLMRPAVQGSDKMTRANMDPRMPEPSWIKQLKRDVNPNSSGAYVPDAVFLNQCIEMADFSGKGEVTAREVFHFLVLSGVCSV